MGLGSEAGTATNPLVLHAAWHASRRIALWGESDPQQTSVARRRARKPRPGRAPVHPFASTPHELRRALVRLGGAGLLARAETGDASLTLPSRSGRPLPSPWRSVRDARDGSPARLAERPMAWEVPALGLDLGVARPIWEALLDGSARRHVEPAGTLAFLAHLWNLAGAIVGRAAVLPQVVDGPDGPEARWQPLPSAELDSLLELLTDSMPRSIRSHGDRFGPPILSAELDRDRSIASDILSTAIDARARHALSSRAHRLPRRGFDPRHMSTANAWLAALASDDATVRGGERSEMEGLRVELDRWRDGHWQRAPRLTACLRLRQPKDAGEGNPQWRLELGAVDPERERSFCSAPEIWHDARSAHTDGQDAREALLTGLGLAMELFPELGAESQRGLPESIRLDTGAAYRFLRDVTPLLRDRGVAVVVPIWWRRNDRPRLTVTLSLRSEDPPPADMRGARGRSTGLVSGRWRVSLGGRELGRADLSGMAGRHLVEVDGSWTHVTPEEIEAALAILDRPTVESIPLTEALKRSVGPEPLPMAKLETTGRLKQLLDGGGRGAPEPVPPPEGFRGTLRPYQESGLGWLCLLEELGLGALLADDMGLGKTVQALALVACDRRDAESPGPTLVVTPTSVLGGWIRESERFVPDLRLHVHHGPDRNDSGGLTAGARRADIVLTTYATAVRDEDILRDTAWRRLILDEAQMLKNPSTRQRRSLAGIEVPRRVALTGTPVENRLSELWSIMDILNPGLLGTPAHFRRRYAQPIERLGDGQAATDLKRLTGPFTLRRTKRDRRIVRELPEKMELREYCTIVREQADLYSAIVERMLSRAQTTTGAVRRGHVLTGILRLKQVLNHPAHILADGGPIAERSGKLDRLTILLEEVISTGERALVFTQFAQTGRLLADHLPEALGCEVLHFDGSTPRQGREKAIAAFREPAGPPVFVMSLRAGGLGLNLTAASHVIHFDRWWNPAVEDQATDRAHRIGQRRRVQVRKLISIGTLEERIDGMIEGKRDLAERVMSADGWLTEMTTDELREIVRLSEGSVA